MKKCMCMMMAFLAMFILVALTGCNGTAEDSESQTAPVVEETSAPAVEAPAAPEVEHPAESAKPKDHPAH